jgi:hypothetical protein
MTALKKVCRKMGGRSLFEKKALTIANTVIYFRPNQNGDLLSA